MVVENKVKGIKANRNLYFLSLMAFMLAGTFLTLYIVSDNFPLAMIGVFIFDLLPFLFIKKIVTLFEKNISFIFFDSYFSIEKSSVNDESQLMKQDFNYDDIDFCIVESSQGQYSTIIISFFNSKKLNYTLRSDNDNKINLSKMIYENIISKHFVYLKPTFFASRNGKIFIYCLLILIILALAMHIFYSPTTSLYTLMISIGIFASILLRRKIELDTFNEMNDKFNHQN